MRKFLATLILVLMSSQAIAASRVWITEFTVARVEAAAPFATLPSMIKQPTLDLSGGGAKTSAVFNAQTRYIRIVCEVQCAISGTGTATINDVLLPPMRPEYFGVQGGKTLSVISVPP